MSSHNDPGGAKKSKVNLKTITSQTKTPSQALSRLRMRKQSFGFGAGVPGIGGGVARRRSSQIGIEFKRPALLYLNTFQLEPRVRFHPAKVLKAIDAILDAFYTPDHKYSVMDSPGHAMLLAGEIMRAVKNLNFNRYRIIAVVTLAQKRAQSYNNAVAFLWDHEFDGIVNTQREDNTSFLQVTVFGVYLD